MRRKPSAGVLLANDEEEDIGEKETGEAGVIMHWNMCDYLPESCQRSFKVRDSFLNTHIYIYLFIRLLLVGIFGLCINMGSKRGWLTLPGRRR